MKYNNFKITNSIDKIKIFEKNIEYKFLNINLLFEALTHPSLTRQYNFNYENLEFIGDSALSIAISTLLMRNMNNKNEGLLSKMHNYLVSRGTVFSIGIDLNIGEFMFLSNSEDNNGGRTNRNNISNAMEAVLGAIYLDSYENNYIDIINVVQKHWNNQINFYLQYGDKTDPKTVLQELTQKKWKIYPQYETKLDSNMNQFITHLRVNNKNSIGISKNKQQSEIIAATKLLNKILKFTD